MLFLSAVFNISFLNCIIVTLLFWIKIVDFTIQNLTPFENEKIVLVETKLKFLAALAALYLPLSLIDSLTILNYYQTMPT